MKSFSVKISFESRLDFLPMLRKIIRSICSDQVINNENFFHDIDLCLNEAVTNIIKHAYNNEHDHEIEIILTLSATDLFIKILDTGARNPRAYKNHTLKETDKIEELGESGRGVFILNELMDEVIYKTEEKKNTLSMRKFFK